MPEYELKIRPGNGKWFVEWTDSRGIRNRRSTGESDKARAGLWLTNFIVATVSAPRKSATMEIIWLSYLDTIKGKAFSATAPYQWRSLSPVFGGLFPAQVTDAVCSQYIAQRTKAGRARQTIKNELNLLRIVMSHGAKCMGVTNAPHVKVPAGSPPRKQFLTREEFKQLLVECREEHLRLFCLMAISTAARNAAICELTWDRVDFKTGLIDLVDPYPDRPQKHRAVVPMTKTLRAALDRAYEGRLSNHVISWNGKPVSRIRGSLARAATRAGLKVTPHMFRHSAARWMIADGVGMDKVSLFLGHENIETTRRVYARYAPDFLASSVSSLEIDVMPHENIVDIRSKSYMK